MSRYKRIKASPPGLTMNPWTTILPNVLSANRWERQVAEWTVLTGEAALLRDGVLEDLPLELRLDVPMVALTGPSGVGKTTLANHLWQASRLPLRTFRRYATRTPRRGERKGENRYFRFIGKAHAERMIERNFTNSPRHLALGNCFAWQWTLLSYPGLSYDLRASQQGGIILPCHLDTALKLKKRGFYSLVICYKAAPWHISLEHIEHQEFRPHQPESEAWWRSIHALVMDGLVDEAFERPALGPSIDAVLVAERYSQTERDLLWNKYQLSEVSSQLTQLYAGTLGVANIQPVADAFAHTRELKTAILSLVKNRAGEIRELAHTPAVQQALNGQEIVGAIPLPDYRLFGPGDTHP